jgi:hypothetical protein
MPHLGMFIANALPRSGGSPPVGNKLKLERRMRLRLGGFPLTFEEFARYGMISRTAADGGRRVTKKSV